MEVLSNQELRKFITTHFNDSELETFCFDYFPEVLNDFSDGMRKNKKVMDLVIYCHNRQLTTNLLANLRQERQTIYQQAFNPKESLFAPPTKAKPRDPKQIFISYSREDAAPLASRIAKDLRDKGHPVWIAPESIAPGEKWGKAIERGLQESGIFILLLTPKAVDSFWVNKEMDAAIRLHGRGQMRVLPLDVEACTPPLFWEEYQFISFRDGYKKGRAQLWGALAGQPVKPQPRRATTPPPAKPQFSTTSKVTENLSNQSQELPDWMMWGGVIVALMIVFGIAYAVVSSGNDDATTAIKIAMGQHIAYADGAGDDTDLAREHYAAALELAAEGRAMRPQDVELDRLRMQVLTALDGLDSVIRLTARPFYEYAEGTGLTAISLREGYEGGIYTIDTANDAAYYHHTDQTYLTVDPLKDVPDRILFAGQAIGSETIANLVDGLWNYNNFLTLDSTGLLLTQYPTNPNVSVASLGLASDWQQPTDMDMFNGRLYILDTGVGEIWKYFGDGDGGYVADSSERVVAFDANVLDPDIAHIIDFDIYGEDGSLFAVYGDGRVRYYDTQSGRVSWDETDLLNNGLRLPLVSPVAGKIIGHGLTSSIFVADPGSGRIVQISRAGTVLAQYRASTDDGTELFNTITDFTVAENPLRLFVTTPTTLYTAILE